MGGGRRLEASTPAATRTADDILTVFSVLWAIATLFHVWVNARALGVLRDPHLLGVSHVMVAIAAIVVLLRPRATLPLAALAVLGVVTCWLEAPFLGNHWLLAAFVDVGLLLAMATARRGATVDRERVAASFVPVARLTLVAFYSFAALAKVNRGFVDTKVSCSVFYGDELARSLHLGGLGSGSFPAHLLPWLVIAIEVVIPVMLVVPRTRVAGVAVAIVYHGAIALDMTHFFSDFSSILSALFLLFLPPQFFVGVVDLVRRHRARADAVRSVAIVASAIVLVALWVGGNGPAHRVFVDGRAWAWVVADGAVLAVLVQFLMRPGPDVAATPPGLALSLGWRLVIPALVVVNGLTPYLELKTAYGWNMYSNLVTVAGESNSFVVPATLHLSDVQDDLVRITSSPDPRLNIYATARYDLPLLQLRAFVGRHPDASLTYEWRGQRREASPAGRDPLLARPVPQWQEKLEAFRAVDRERPPRCQPTFFAAH